MHWLKRMILMSVYTSLLVASLIGLILFCLRSVTCCIQERRSSYQCQNFTLISYSLELELGWLLIVHVNHAIPVFLVAQFPEFIGWQRVSQLLIREPKFWSFVYLLAMAVVECVVILGFHEGNRLQEIVVACFLTENITTVVVIGIFNFTQVKKIARRFDGFVQALFKLTMIVFIVSNFIMSVNGTIQLTFKVTGLDRKMSMRTQTDDFTIIFNVARDLANVVFYHRSGMFFWQKLFIDDRNLLSHCQMLSDHNELLDYVDEF